MSLSKLRKIHVIIIGSVLCVLAGVAVFYLMVKPQQEALKDVESKIAQASVKGNEETRAQVEREVQQALADYNIAQQDLNDQMNRRMPYLNFSQRDIGMGQLWDEQLGTLGPLLAKFSRDKGVRVMRSGFEIPPPPFNPNSEVFDKDVLEIPLGDMQVVGDFKSIVKNIKRWNNCNRLVKLGPLKLEGVSPNLQATYPMTVYIFPVEKGGAKIPKAGLVAQN